MMMNKIFWYVFGRFGRNFFLCITTVLTIYLVVDFFEKLRKFSKYDADLSLILSFFAYRIPDITFLLAPLGILMASILTIGGLNRTREITAMRSFGLSFFQIATPFFVFGVFVSLLSFILTAIFIPLANIKAEFVENVLIKHQPEALRSSPDRLWLRVAEGQLLQIDSVGPDGRLITGIHHYRLSDPFGLSEIVTATGGTYREEEWVLENIIERQIGDDGRVLMSEELRRTMALSLTPRDLKNLVSQNPKHMTLYRLKDSIQRLTLDGHNTQRYATDYWSRIAYATVPFVMTLLGVSISLRGTGGRFIGTAKGVGQTLAIGFLFWAVHSVGVVLGQNGAVMPVVGSGIATVMFFMVGANLFLKLK